ncbi:hypothetical protein [Streptomyces sp. NPDC002889]|uniref:hypothetical protein n=1 Tax=Streptomyces sp. NPDC002889 TaxID=3364669 RepID=UPI0036BBF08E
MRSWAAAVALLAGLTVPIVGAAPAAATTGTYAYVANRDADTVSVLDTATHTVTDTVGVGAGPTGVAITLVEHEPTASRLTLRAKKRHSKGSRGDRPITLIARLSADGRLGAARRPLEGATVTFTSNTASPVTLCTATTDGQGRAGCTVPGEGSNDTCYTATFAGDNTFLASTATLCRCSRKNSGNGRDDPWSMLRTAKGPPAARHCRRN